jgi:hypothetical protein
LLTSYAINKKPSNLDNNIRMMTKVGSEEIRRRERRENLASQNRRHLKIGSFLEDATAIRALGAALRMMR